MVYAIFKASHRDDFTVPLRYRHLPPASSANLYTNRAWYIDFRYYFTIISTISFNLLPFWYNNYFDEFLVI